MAVGAVSAEVADRILPEYLPVGRAYRPRPGPWRPIPAPQPITAPRVVACEQNVTQPWGRLHVNYVSLGDRSTSVVATAVEAAPTGEPMTAGERVMLSDDAGHRAVACLNGSSTNGAWEGRLSTEVPLSPDTRWIEIDGVRLDLPDTGKEPPSVRVEQLAEADPGERYLWQRLAVSGRGPSYYRPPRSLNAVAAALVAAGALDPASLVVNQVQAVADALRQGVGAAYWNLPQPWASLIARLGTRDGRRGSVAVGVVTPPVDGVVIGVEGVVLSDTHSPVQSGPARGFEVYVTTSPGVWFGPLASRLDQPQIGWWAKDNRDNYYLGSQGNWRISQDDGQSEGRVNYQPALDPLATELCLMLTGLTEQAVITLPPFQIENPSMLDPGPAAR